jgi:hypothetical protein
MNITYSRPAVKPQVNTQILITLTISVLLVGILFMAASAHATLSSRASSIHAEAVAVSTSSNNSIHGIAIAVPTPSIPVRTEAVSVSSNVVPLPQAIAAPMP